jgi:hypothetical protein
VSHTHTHTHTSVNMVTCVAADVLPSGWAKPHHFIYVAGEMSNDTRALGLACSCEEAGMIFVYTCWHIIRTLTAWISHASFLVLHFTLYDDLLLFPCSAVWNSASSSLNSD